MFIVFLFFLLLGLKVFWDKFEFVIFFLEVIFFDGNLNGIKNRSFLNYVVKKIKFFFNDIEGRWYIINFSVLF